MSYVSISKPVLDRIVQAARETPTEIIGFLLGRLEGDTIVIEDSTTAEFSSERYRVSLPPSSIAVIADKLLSGGLKGNIVGWYHSHTEGGLFFSETDVSTQKHLQQFSNFVAGIVVDSTNEKVGCFRVAPGTNFPVRLPEENLITYTDPAQAVHARFASPLTVPPTPTLEVRRRPPATGPLTRRMALAIILIALAISGIAVGSLAYYFRRPSNVVAILHVPVTESTVGNPIQISANVTGPGRNVTLVYGRSTNGPTTQVPMNPIGAGEYNYVIPGSQVTGDLAYYIKAYDPTGRELNTTTYQITVADFSLQPLSSAVVLYVTKTASVGMRLLAINNFNGQLQLSANNAPPGLEVSFPTNSTTPGSTVQVSFTAESNTPNGTFPVAIVATYLATQSSQVTRQAVIDVTVADFHLAVSPTSRTVSPGASTNFTLTLTLENGFTDTVKITDLAGLPPGAVYKLAASNSTILAGGPGSTTVSIQIKIPVSTKPGTYPIVIVAVGGGVSHYQTAQIIVK